MPEHALERRRFAARGYVVVAGLPRFPSATDRNSRARSRATGRPRLRRRDARSDAAEKLPSSIPSYLRGWRQLRRVHGGLDCGPHRSLSSAWSPRRRLRSGERVRIHEELCSRSGSSAAPLGEPGAVPALVASSYVQNFKTPTLVSRASWTSAYPSSRAWECSPRCSGAGSNRGCSTSPTRALGPQAEEQPALVPHGARLDRRARPAGK